MIENRQNKGLTDIPQVYTFTQQPLYIPGKKVLSNQIHRYNFDHDSCTDKYDEGLMLVAKNFKMKICTKSLVI